MDGRAVPIHQPQPEARHLRRTLLPLAVFVAHCSRPLGLFGLPLGRGQSPHELLLSQSNGRPVYLHDVREA
eukprot:scaffold97267_cov36-Phaeocystis_antarctica.AAC.2